MNFKKHIALICNPTQENEKALRITQNIETLLSGMDIPHQTFIERWPEAFEEFTEVWIIGGDGTANWFINQYPTMPLPMAIFPGGSGNDFQWMLYKEKSTEQQVDQVLQSLPQLVDAGICNGQYFFNGVGIGFDGAIVHDLLGKKKLSGKASYLLSVIKQVVGYCETTCTLEMPNEVIREDCFMISVANGKRYGGGFCVAPKASIDDGLLDINIVGKISSWGRMRYLPIIEKGEHLQLDFVQYRQTNKIKIQSPIKLHAHLDGEYLYTDRFEIEVLPKQFSFLY